MTVGVDGDALRRECGRTYPRRPLVRGENIYPSAIELVPEGTLPRTEERADE